MTKEKRYIIIQQPANFCVVGLASNQVIVNNTWTRVQYNGLIDQVGAVSYDLINFQFNILTDGVFDVRAWAIFPAAAGVAGRGLRIIRNVNTEMARHLPAVIGATQQGGITMGRPMVLNAGNLIRIEVMQLTGANMTLAPLGGSNLIGASVVYMSGLS